MDEIVSKKSVMGWWIFGIALVVIATIVFGALNYADIIFRTKMEREVFESSYQKKAGDAQQKRILQAQLAEIEQQLLDPKLDPQTRRQLKQQAAAIRVRLRAQ